MAYREFAEATNNFIWKTLHCSMWKWGLVIFAGHCGLLKVSKPMNVWDLTDNWIEIVADTV